MNSVHFTYPLAAPTLGISPTLRSQAGNDSSMPASSRSDELLALLLMLPLPLPLPPLTLTPALEAPTPLPPPTAVTALGALLLAICCGTVLFDKSSIIRFCSVLRSRYDKWQRRCRRGPWQSTRHSQAKQIEIEIAYNSSV